MKFLFLIPLFPLLGFLFNFTVGVRVLAAGRATRHAATAITSTACTCRLRPGSGSSPPGRCCSPSWCPWRRWSRPRTPPTTRWSRRCGPGSRAGRPQTALGAGALHRRLGLPGGPALVGDAAGRHLRGLLHPRVLDRVHGPRPRLRALHVVPEPLHVRDAHPRARRQLPRALRGLGGRRPLLVPAHRVLVREAERLRRGQEGLHRQPHRRRRLRAGHVPDLHDLRQRSTSGR